MNLVLDTTSDDGIQVEAITIREFLGAEEGFLVGNRPINQAGLEYFTNILYDFDDATGCDRDQPTTEAGSMPVPERHLERSVKSIPWLRPGRRSERSLESPMPRRLDRNGVATPSLFDGDTFTLSNVTETVTFEFDQGFTLLPMAPNPSAMVTLWSLTTSFLNSTREPDCSLATSHHLDC